MKVKYHCPCHRHSEVKHVGPCCDNGYIEILDMPTELKNMEHTSHTFRFSAHKFKSEKDLTFDPADYSKFKFGCKDAARNFGTELAVKFIESLYYSTIKAICDKQKNRIIVLSSPYVHIPTATFALKDYFIRAFNAQLVSDGYDTVIEVKIYRKSSYKEEYGEMSREERFKIMENDSFHVDASLLRNNVLLFLDDIIITGAHEYRIQKMLEKYDLHFSNYNFFLYFAELSSQHTNPNIENYLNYYFVKDLVALNKIITNEPHLMNTRTVKYILNANHDECKNFLHYQKYSFLHNLYHQAIGNSYHKIEDYQQNLSYLKNLLSQQAQ